MRKYTDLILDVLRLLAVLLLLPVILLIIGPLLVIAAIYGEVVFGRIHLSPGRSKGRGRLWALLAGLVIWIGSWAGVVILGLTLFSPSSPAVTENPPANQTDFEPMSVTAEAGPVSRVTVTVYTTVLSSSVLSSSEIADIDVFEMTITPRAQVTAPPVLPTDTPSPSPTPSATLVLPSPTLPSPTVTPTLALPTDTPTPLPSPNATPTAIPPTETPIPPPTSALPPLPLTSTTAIEILNILEQANSLFIEAVESPSAENRDALTAHWQANALSQVQDFVDRSVDRYQPPVTVDYQLTISPTVALTDDDTRAFVQTREFWSFTDAQSQRDSLTDYTYTFVKQGETWFIMDYQFQILPP